MNTQDNRPTQLDRLHAVVEHLEDNPDLVEHVTDVDGLWPHAAYMRLHLPPSDTAAPLVAWARSLNADRVHIDQTAVKLHLSVLGEIGGHDVRAVQVMSPTRELVLLGDAPSVAAVERATGLAVDPVAREHGLAALDRAAATFQRMGGGAR